MPSLELRRLQIPFTAPFRHASAERSTGDSLLVVAKNADGLCGYGEGCPRSYVTGESWETALGFFGAFRDRIAGMTSVSDVREFVEEQSIVIDANPAAWCAVELALFDLFAKERGGSIEALLGLPELSGTFRYSAILSASQAEMFRTQLLRYKKAAFSDYKLKVVGDLARDRERLNIVWEELGDGAKLRLDANNAWSSAEDAITFLEGLGIAGLAVEEPVSRGHYQDLLEVISALRGPIILDESFLREEHFARLGRSPDSWIINLRISKMGGLLRTLRIAKQAQLRKVRVIVGAHVGETSILSRAALVVANAFPDLMGQEGAFGELLLERDIVRKPVQFGVGGLLDSGLLEHSTSGLGLDIDWETLRRFS